MLPRMAKRSCAPRKKVSMGACGGGSAVHLASLPARKHTHTHTDSPALLQRPAAEATAPLGIAQPPCSLLPAHHSLLQISLPARTPALHPPAEAAEALTTLPGIGPKVAACICLFSLDKHEAIPGACGRGKARVAPLVDWTEGSAVWNLGHLTAAARLPAPLAMLLSRAHELCLQRGAST